MSPSLATFHGTDTADEIADALRRDGAAVVRELVAPHNPTTMHSATPIGAATGPDDTRILRRISLHGKPSVFS